MRIEQREDGIFLMASPMGRPPTPFRMVSGAANRVVFENPEHDYPQRIIYELAEDCRLHAGIEGSSDGKSKRSSWQWSRLASVTEPL